MHTYMIEEMADAISQGLCVDNRAVLSILHHYWEEKIALTWHVEDMLQAALNAGKPITKGDAVALLYTMLDDHDPMLGVCWQTLEIELQEYHLDWKRLTEDKYGEVRGVFKVWRKGDLIAHQIGLFPNDVQGNLPEALVLARSMADETPGVPILIGCEPRHSDNVEPWLSVTREKDETHIQERQT